jgi:hypothetical protein
MGNVAVAVVIFGIIVTLYWFFINKLGNYSFWKLAGRFPDLAYAHVSTDPTWVVQQGNEESPGQGYVGPFRLVVPRLETTVRLYAREDQMLKSQARFIESCQELMPKHGFPYLGLAALLFPVVAMVSMRNEQVALSPIVGYGLSNLGYLLAAATIVPGHFRVLGLESRIPTFISAVLFFSSGALLFNAF